MKKLLQILEEVVKEVPYQSNKELVTSAIDDVMRRRFGSEWTKKKYENFEIRCGVRSPSVSKKTRQKMDEILESKA